ncbi:MAG: zinc-ribbon domain-containing protein [Pseudomonadota bacterium]
MIVTCKGCSTSFNLEDERVKKTGSKARCSICKIIFMVYPPVAIEEQDLPESTEKQELGVPPVKEESFSFSDSEVSEAIEEEVKPEVEEVAQSDQGDKLPGEEELDFTDLSISLEKQEVVSTDVSADSSDEKLELSDPEDLNISEFDEALEKEEVKPEVEEVAQSDQEDKLSGEEELDFADLNESLEMGEVASTADSREKPETSDSEEIDFSELEKMLENGEISFDNLLSEDNDNKNELKFSDTEEIDLSEIDAAIDNFEDLDLEEIEDDTKELKLEFENDLDSQIIKSNGVEELDFSDLESMPDVEETSDSTEDDNKTADLTLNLDIEPESVTQTTEEEPDELDFSDLEKMLDNETGTEESVVNPAEDTSELTLEMDMPSDSKQNLNFEDTVALDEDTLDFSDLEKMLDKETITDEPVEELSDETLEVSIETEESDNQEADYLATTVAIDDTRHDSQPDKAEPGDIHKHVAEDTVIVGAKKPSGKVAPPPIKKKSLGKLLLILTLIVVLLMGAAAFIFFKPFGIEVPYVSEYIESKIDKNGNLKITPIRPSIKGDFVDTKSGTFFVVTGKVKNDYSHPRSNIKVIGEIFTKGNLYKAKSVYCGNIISEEDLLQIDPAIIQRKLQNRLGDKKSNISVKPGSIIPFMVIFENPSSDIDEFNVNVESSIKG